MSKNEFKRHLLDFSGSSVASAAATAADAVLYASLLFTLVRWESVSLGLAAGIGALLGGIVHYTMCRFWVFRRFEAPLFCSVAIYFAMSWVAAAGHGFFTGWLASLAGAGLAWAVSKGVIWVAWTYPMSRYVVFNDSMGDQPTCEDAVRNACD
ncbi:MAG: hypothetical protein ACOC9W_00240 [Persicimonas sp.]